MKKTLAILLVIAMLLVMLPTMALAATTDVRNSADLATAITNAADGDTIFMFDGTYALAQTTIDKNLAFEGESEDGVVLIPTGSTGNSGDARGWILVNDGVTLNLSDLTMDGSGFDIYQAVRAHGEVNIENVTICNIRHTLYRGFGIAALGGTSITDVTMYNIERVGISVYGGDVRHDMTIDGFDYTGKGDVDGLDYAIEVGAMSGSAVPFTVNISNVTITDNLAVAASDGSGSGGILITTYFYAAFGGDPNMDLITVNIDHASISNSSAGVMVGYMDGYAECSDVTVSSSNFINCEHDLEYYGDVDTGSFTTSGNYYGGGAPTVALGDGNVIDGIDTYVAMPIAMTEDTDVTAGVDPAFMIIIPAAVDFGALQKNTGFSAQSFPVEAVNVVIEPGYQIDVSVTSPFVMKDMDGAGTVELPYALFDEEATNIATGQTFASFVADRIEAGAVQVDTSLITTPGSYKGTMDFTIAYQAIP